MKTKTTTLLFILLIFSTICYARTANSLVIRKDSLQICVVNSGSAFSLLYEIENRSNSTYYLWIGRKIHSTNRERIRDYFMRIRGDFSLYHMAFERNITYLCSGIYSTFLKKIKPQETFTIQILSDERFSECKKKQIFRYLDEHVVIVSENTLTQYLVGVHEFNPRLFYRHNFITIPVNMLDFSVTNMRNQ